MQPVRILMALLSVIAALTLVGLGSASASTAAVQTTSCHDTAQDGTAHHDMTPDSRSKAPDKTPIKSMKVMACCIACVAATLPAPETTPVRFGRSDLQPLPHPVHTGRTPAPEPEPPKA